MASDATPLGTALWRVTDDDLREVCGDTTFTRGRTYAGQRRVQHLKAVGPDEIVALVRGQGRTYETSVEVHDEADLVSFFGECSCPVGVDCKHVVAVLLTARRTLAAPDQATLWSGVPGGSANGSALPVPAPAWERLLGDVLAPAVESATHTPVGLLVEVQETHTGRYSGSEEASERYLTIRPVIPGKTAWIKTGVSWSTLDYLGHGGLRINPRHKAALQAVAALQRSSHHYYQTPDRIRIDALGQRWLSSLRECQRAGITLLTDTKRTGAVVLGSDPAYLSIDLAGDDDGGVQLTPALGLPPDLAGNSATSGWLAVGTPPVGVWAMAGPDLLFAEFDPPLDLPTFRLLQHGPVAVQPHDVPRFLTGAVPSLARRFHVDSADGSVPVSCVVGPRLLLGVTHVPGLRLRLDWSFTYAIGDAHLRIGVGTAEHRDLRDAAVEGALIARLDCLDQVPGLRSTAIGGPPRMEPITELEGFAVVEFLDKVLPRLQAHPDLDVEVSGEPVDYSEATEPATIRLSVTETSDAHDWFDLAVDVRVGDEQVPMADLVTAFTLGEEQIILPTGTWFRVDRPELVELRRLVEEARAMQESPRGPLRITPYQADLWAELEAIGVVEEQSARWTAVVQGLSRVAVEPLAPPAGLAAMLRPYQHEGLEWLSFLRRHGLGGILADDMGLGKTMQCLAMVLQAQADAAASGADADTAETDRVTPEGPWLVVAPSSVLPVWAAEAARFAPSLSVVVVDETGMRRGASVAEVTAEADLVVTSYAVFRLDHDAFAEVGWAGLILDEAQFVKNHQSKTYQCVRTLSARSKFAITGTPMENNLMELWSLLSIVAPGLFPRPSTFQEHYRRPIESGSAPDRLDTLRRRIRPVMLRRTKDVVAAELPPKQEQVLKVELPPRHRRLYDRALARERQRVLGLLDDPNRNRIAIFRSLTLLRQLSLHPGLVDSADLAVGSPKIETLVEMLGPVLAEGHKAIVFSQFTGFLAQVRARFDAEGISFAYLDGRTRKRQEAIDSFTGGDRQVFLISLKAGGFGLTLTAADYVFLLDPWWNPATEAQAIDRTHRIGQDKHVNVYRLVAADTIEEKVLALQERKRELFAQVVDAGALASGAMSADDIRGLL